MILVIEKILNKKKQQQQFFKRQQQHMHQNPQKIIFYKQYCKKHPNNKLQYICNKQQCDYYLNFQCFQCRQDNTIQHPHQCIKSQYFVKQLHEQIIKNLTIKIKQQIQHLQHNIHQQIKQFIQILQNWYSPLDQSTTQKQFVYTVENPSKWQKIQQITQLKDNIISYRIKQLGDKFRKQINYISNKLDQQMYQYKYRIVPLQWKFDRLYTHQLLNISGYKDRIIDKKSQKQKYCISITNQPLTPLKNQIIFTINSQNPYDRLIILGLCNKRQIQKLSYQTDLKKYIYGIYQAAKSGSSNNALSLHYNDQAMHYKQAVGWNFRSGDQIFISFIMDKDSKDKVRIQFRKKKEVFQIFVRKCFAFLYPFVALFSAGDKVSIENP